MTESIDSIREKYHYISDFFSLVEVEHSESVKNVRLTFKCLKCQPKIRTLSCSSLTIGNLKKHIERVHPSCSGTYAKLRPPVKTKRIDEHLGSTSGRLGQVRLGQVRLGQVRLQGVAHYIRFLTDSELAEILSDESSDHVWFTHQVSDLSRPPSRRTAHLKFGLLNTLCRHQGLEF